MGTTSVRPANLQRYVSGSRAVEQHLRERIRSLTQSYRAFQASSGITVANPGLIDRALPDLEARLQETRTWVDVLHDAVLRADRTSEDGTVTIGDVELQQLMVDVARSRGIDLQELSAPDRPFEVDPPTVGPIPQNSGYVDDPVCTATGHFLEDEIDLAMPERLRHLRWARRYSSRQLDENGHGRGWWTWADARCTKEEGVVTLICPEGRHVSFVAPDGDEPAHTDGADVTLRRIDGRWAVRWGSRSLDGPETWWFGDDGLVERVESPLRGDLAFEHDGGRLVAIRHQGGRSLTIVWDGDRIAAVRSSDGREVRYRYSSTGDLVEVERAIGGRRYEPDSGGRIVRVVDADGVVLCVNRYDDAGRVVRQVAATGRVSVFRYEPGRRTDLLDTTGRLLARYEHDLRGRVERFVAPSGARLERRFDADGCVVEQRAADGSWFVAEGSSAPGGELRVTHGDGRVEVFRYDDVGRVGEHRTAGAEPVRLTYEGGSPLPTLIDGPLGWRQTFEWGPSGERRSFTDADGVTVAWSSDAEGMPSGFVDGAGNELRVRRHATGVVEHVALPDGGVVSVDVDDAGRPVRIVDPTGVATAFAYTPAGRLAAADHPATGRLTFTYAGSGFLERVTDALGATVSYERDELGRATSVGTPDGGTWRFQHSALGVLVQVTSPGGATWRQDLDEHHRVERTHGPDYTVELAYDDAGRLHRAAGALTGFDVVFARGALASSVTSRPGGRIELDWDQRDRPAIVRDADGVETRYEWTPGNRLAAVGLPGGTVERRYDETGALVALHTPGGGEWTFEHDWLGRAQTASSPEGRVARIERDAAGRTVAYEQGGATTRYEYDDRGRLAQTVLPTGARATVRYDEAGRPVEIGNAGGSRTRLVHDGAGRVVREIDPLGGEIALERDAEGNIVARRDRLGRETRCHRGPRGTLASVERPDGSVVRWELDDTGRVAAVRSGDDVVARYGYGADGLLASIEEPARGRTARLTRTAAGRLATWDDGEGVRVAYDRVDGDVVRRRGTGLADAGWTHGPDRTDGIVGGLPVSIVADLDGSTREVRVGEQALRIGRDAHGRIVGAGDLSLGRDELGRIVDIDGTTRCGYDEVGHLAWHEGPDGRTEWDYDQLGRLVEERRGDTVRRFGYDAAHQLVSVTSSDGGTTTYTYDECGRRVAEEGPAGHRRFEWDALGRLAAVIVGDERIEVDIDAFGLLRGVGSSRVDWDHAGTEPVPAAVDGRPLVSVGPLVVADGERLVPSGLVGPAAGPSPWGWANDEPVVQVDTGLPGGLGFAGLVWLGARIYDPATRQFLSPDPLPGMLGTSVAANPYHYADNDPLNRCDPTGLNGQPISIDDFERMKDDATGFQWDNVAKVGIAVAGAVVMGALMASGVGIVGLAIAGGVVGASSAGLGGVIDGKPGDAILRDMAIGGAFGAAGGAAGGWVAGASRGVPLSQGIAIDVATGFPVAAGQEAASSYLPGPGADGQMNWERPIIDTIANTGGSRLGQAGANRFWEIDLRGPLTGEAPPTIDLAPSGSSPLAPPRSPSPIVLPNDGLPRFPGSSLIDPNGHLPRSPGGIVLPSGVGAR